MYSFQSLLKPQIILVRFHVSYILASISVCIWFEFQNIWMECILFKMAILSQFIMLKIETEMDT